MVPSDTSGTDTPSVPATHDVFVELVCADDDLLGAEFAAIVAANWTVPPSEDDETRPSGQPAGPRGPGGPTDRWTATDVLASRSHPWSRERSPPIT